MRCALGQTWSGLTCDDEAQQFDWKSAQMVAESLNRSGGYADYRDWRVPTIDELKTLRFCKSKTSRHGIWLVDELACVGNYSCPTIDSQAFPENPCGPFWSSSPSADDSSYAWYVSFNDGYLKDYGKSFQRYVRLVRDRQ